MPAHLVNGVMKQDLSDDCIYFLWKSVSEEDEVSTLASSSDPKTEENM